MPIFRDNTYPSVSNDPLPMCLFIHPRNIVAIFDDQGNPVHWIAPDTVASKISIDDQDHLKLTKSSGSKRDEGFYLDNDSPERNNASVSLNRRRSRDERESSISSEQKQELIYKEVQPLTVNTCDEDRKRTHRAID